MGKAQMASSKAASTLYVFDGYMSGAGSSQDPVLRSSWAQWKVQLEAFMLETLTGW